jgi:hypothetical protein
MCWILLGIWMGWIQTVYGKPGEKQLTATDSPPHEAFPEPPEMFKADPAVLEAGRIIKGRSIAHFIPDGRVVR